MPRYMHKDDVEAFRVIITSTRQGDNTYTECFGTYHDLKTARGIITREKRLRRYRPNLTFSAVIEKSSLQWEEIETVASQPGRGGY
jgi:hypothetical protein